MDINARSLELLNSENIEDIALGARIIAKDNGLECLEALYEKLPEARDSLYPILAATRRYIVYAVIRSLRIND